MSREVLEREYATPVGDRVLVKLIKQPDQFSNGLAIPESAKRLPVDGIVIAVGDSKRIEVKPGDRVCFDRYAGIEVKLNGEEHIVMSNDEVLGLVE